MKYRVRKVRTSYGPCVYLAEYRWCFLWFGLGGVYFSTIDGAIDRVNEDIYWRKTKTIMWEYDENRNA